MKKALSLIIVCALCAIIYGTLSAQNTAPKKETYKIGETGPGGGVIFSVKGNTYMEVSRYLGNHVWEKALKTAKDYRGGGYRDWSLPSKDDLNLIYKNLVKSGIENLGSWHWSSTQYISFDAWSQNLSSGLQRSSAKIHILSVCAVRTFTPDKEVAQEEQKEKIQKEYKIGDIGPAGGIVFYDKGKVSDGWRYLEAAPAETEFTAGWGAYGEDVNGTRLTVGMGKQNTQFIIDALKERGETGMAAQICASLKFGGYSDWFLPGKEELNLMYKNLKKKGFGGFAGTWYWSSSENSVNTAWDQNFSNGYQNYYHFKNDTRSVRAIRAF